MNRLQSQVQLHLSAVRQNTEKLLTKENSKESQQPPGYLKLTPPQTHFQENLKNSSSHPSNFNQNPVEKTRFAKQSHFNDNDFRNSYPNKRERRAGLSASSPLSLDFPHRLFTPEHYEERYEYPLVIWLHSQDSSEYELDGVMPHLSLRNYVAIAPRAINASKRSERKFCWSELTSSAASAEALVMQSIAHAISDLSVSPSRVFLAGYGTGGTLAQWIGLRNSESIAGVVSINGPFPQHYHSASQRHHSASQRRVACKLPVMFIHGGDSILCDADQTCNALKSAHREGLSFNFVQFPCGDELNTAMTAIANQFIMKIVNA